MLITFTSKHNPDIVMFQDVASVLLKAMGESDQPPGILRGENIARASARLESYLQRIEEVSAEENDGSQEHKDNDMQEGEEDKEEKKARVSLRTRALPLLEMLDTAYREEVDVIWK